MLSELFFLGDTLLGVLHWPQPRTDACSVLYYCPTCGTIWARRILQGTDNGWLAQGESCPKHGAGTLLSDFSIDAFVDGYLQFPLPVLQREFLLRVNDL